MEERLMRHIVSTGVLAAGLFATAYAQVPASPAGAQQPSARPDQAKSIVVTGCVGGGPAAFTLSNAMAAASPAKPGESPVGTTGISSAYDLTPRAGVDLSVHVGHKVEITGTPAEASSSAPAPSVPAAGAGDKPAAGAGRAPAAKLNVTAVKMVSASCP